MEVKKAVIPAIKLEIKKAVIPAIKLEIKKDGAILFIIALIIIFGGKMIQRLKLAKVDSKY